MTEAFAAYNFVRLPEKILTQSQTSKPRNIDANVKMTEWNNMHN